MVSSARAPSLRQRLLNHRRFLAIGKERWLPNRLSGNDAVARERARLGRGGWRPRQPLLGAAAMTHHLVTPRLPGPPGEGAAWERPRRARSPNTTAWTRLSVGVGRGHGGRVRAP